MVKEVIKGIVIVVITIIAGILIAGVMVWSLIPIMSWYHLKWF